MKSAILWRRLSRLIKRTQPASALQGQRLEESKSSVHWLVARAGGLLYVCLQKATTMPPPTSKDEAVHAIVTAWTDAGPRPDVHRAAQQELLRAWPTLAKAIKALVASTAPPR